MGQQQKAIELLTNGYFFRAMKLETANSGMLSIQS